MASVAADTGAIAPPLPLPSRPDAGSPAGPSGGFADLLDASGAPATAPQPQQPSGPPAGDGSNAAQTNGAGGNGASGTAPAGAGAAPNSARGKSPGGGKSTGGAADDGNSGGNAAGDVPAVAGLAVPPFAFASLPAADQTPAASQDPQTPSAGPTAPTQGAASVPPTDHKDSDAQNDPSPAGLAAAIPGLVSVITVVAPASSASAGSGPVASLPSGATVSAGTASAPIAPGPDAANIAAPPAPQPDGTAPPGQPASTDILDLLAGMPSAAAATGERQTILPEQASAATDGGAPDRNAPATPAASPAITAVPAAALNPPAVVTPTLAEIEVAAETVGNTAPPRDAAAAPIALPAQVAIRFATPAPADDDASSDNGTDVLRGFGGASAGATTAPGSAANAPGFTGILSTMQAPPGPPPPVPQHPAAPSEAVSLAAVPIAIVTRAEAGERKFEIRLDPPDLGRIEVQLNVDGSGRATSHLVVDRADTLDLLRRDAPALERALQSAGLTTDNGSLQFSLRDQSFAGREQAPPAPLATPATASGTETEVAPIDAALRSYGAAAGLGGGIDIRV